MLPKRRMLLNSDEKRKAHQNVALARGRLKGALKHKGVSSDNSDSDESTDEKRANEQESEASSLHQPYFMKLFERSIDLARFRENSPLYPLCRAWMKNQPTTKDVNEPERKKPRIANKREYNPDIVEQFMNGDLSKINEMPRPEPEDGMERFCFQKAEPVADVELNQSALNRNELMADHLAKWKNIRQSWISHRKQYETKRYGESFKLLDALKRDC